MKKFQLSAVMALSGACLHASAAQTEAANDSTVINLEEVQVVATRATAQTPVAYSVVNAETLKSINSGVDLPYLLSMTPSVTTTSDAGAGVGYTSMRIRGTDASRINVTTNGIAVNDGESHNVYWVNMPDIASSVKDIQIQRGVGTSTNGAGAFGASINMVTASPSHDPYAALDASWGMYNTNKQTLRAGTGLLGGHWTVDARLSHVGTDGYIDRAWAKLWSYMGQVGYYNGGTSLRLLAFGGRERTYMAWDYATADQIETYGRRYNPCGAYTDSDGNQAFYPNQIDNYSMHNFQLLFGQRLRADLRIDAALHYTKGDGYYEQYKTKKYLVEYGLQDFTNSEGATISRSDLVRYKNMDNGTGGIVASMTFRRDGINSVIGGAASTYRGHHFGQVGWVRNYVGPIDPLQEYYRNLGEKFDANIYAKASATLWRGLSLYADMQYRHIDYSITGISDNYDWNTGAMQELDIHHHYNFFNPKGGINFESGANRAYFSFGVAHKEPTRDTFLDNGPLQQPVPERLDDWELGYEYRSRLITVGVNLYYMNYKDQLVPTGQLSDTGNAVNVNVPKSYRRGAEISLALKPTSWFDWQFTTTLSQNRVKDFVEYIYDDNDWSYSDPLKIPLGDTPLAFSPSLTLNNTFNFAWKGMEASLMTRYVGDQYMTNTGNEADRLEHYCVTDLHLGYKFNNIIGIKTLQLGFTIYNLFSEKYYNNGYAGAGYWVDDNGEKQIYHYAGYAAQAPIHVMGSISLNF